MQIMLKCVFIALPLLSANAFRIKKDVRSHAASVLHHYHSHPSVTKHNFQNVISQPKTDRGRSYDYSTNPYRLNLQNAYQSPRPYHRTFSDDDSSRSSNISPPDRRTSTQTKRQQPILQPINIPIILHRLPRPRSTPNYHKEKKISHYNQTHNTRTKKLSSNLGFNRNSYNVPKREYPKHPTIINPSYRHLASSIPPHLIQKFTIDDVLHFNIPDKDKNKELSNKPFLKQRSFVQNTNYQLPHRTETKHVNQNTHTSRGSEKYTSDDQFRFRSVEPVPNSIDSKYQKYNRNDTKVFKVPLIAHHEKPKENRYKQLRSRLNPFVKRQEQPNNSPYPFSNHSTEKISKVFEKPEAMSTKKLNKEQNQQTLYPNPVTLSYQYNLMPPGNQQIVDINQKLKRGKYVRVIEIAGRNYGPPLSHEHPQHVQIFKQMNDHQPSPTENLSNTHSDDSRHSTTLENKHSVTHKNRISSDLKNRHSSSFDNNVKDHLESTESDPEEDFDSFNDSSESEDAFSDNEEEHDGFLDMGAYTDREGSFGWYADFPVGRGHDKVSYSSS